MRKRIAFVLLALAVLAVLCSCAVKKNSSDEAGPTVTRLYGKVAKSDAPDCSDIVVTVNSETDSFSVNTDADGNYSIEVPAGTYTGIEFDSSCWFAEYTFRKPIELAEGSEVKIPDYRLKSDHYFDLVESKEATTEEPGYEKYVCEECGMEKIYETGTISSVKWAGIRVSSYGIRGSYGEDNFPSPTDMSGIIGKMEGLYEGSTGACILIVGTVSERTWDCRLAFPLSHDIDRVQGSDEDFYEPYITAFDKAGYEVWLQVEPGEADLVELATEVMNRYKSHPSVKGFGIDVEWHKTEGTDGYGVKLDSETAEAVLAAVRAIDPSYTVFVKHWDSRWLPDPIEGLIYVDDSQQFRSLDEMQEEFSDWAFAFEPCPVMFQIGYRADKRVWGKMDNPALELGKALQSECTYGNVLGIIWVDFTLKEAMDKIK